MWQTERFQMHGTCRNTCSASEPTVFSITELVRGSPFRGGNLSLVGDPWFRLSHWDKPKHRNLSGSDV